MVLQDKRVVPSSTSRVEIRHLSPFLCIKTPIPCVPFIAFKSSSMMALSEVQNTHKCTECSKCFKTKSALKAHVQAVHSPTKRGTNTRQAPARPTKHSSPPQKTAPKNQAPATSSKNRRFHDEVAKSQHHQVVHPAQSAVQSSSASSSVSAPRQMIVHRGITYSAIPLVDHSALETQIVTMCHSSQRLKQEGHTLPTMSRAENIIEDRGGSSAVSPVNDIKRAVVLDCEMAGSRAGKNELIKISLLDFASGEVLIDSFVNPSTQILDWRERCHGINGKVVANAVESGIALDGWAAARAELHRFVDDGTVIVGHSVHHDMRVLHIQHLRIVDTAILTADAVFQNAAKRRRWSLVDLCKELLRIRIRTTSWAQGKQTHDSLEDVYATRELALFCLTKPAELQRWARCAKASWYKAQRAAKQQSQTRRYRENSQRTAAAAGGDPLRGPRYDHEEYTEILRWEDVIDWEMWPKSPPDSD